MLLLSISGIVPNIIYTIQQKKNTRDIYKSSNKLNAYIKFSSHCNKFLKLRQHDYNIYINNTYIIVITNPKYVCKYLITEKLISCLRSSISYLE